MLIDLNLSRDHQQALLEYYLMTQDSDDPPEQLIIDSCLWEPSHQEFLYQVKENSHLSSLVVNSCRLSK